MGGDSRPFQRNIVLFGDSITERGWRVSESGWCAMLSERYSRRAHILNLGHSGYTAPWSLSLLPSLFSAPQLSSRPLLTVVFLGANDAAENPRQITDIERFADSIEKIAEFLLSGYPPQSNKRKRAGSADGGGAAVAAGAPGDAGAPKNGSGAPKNGSGAPQRAGPARPVSIFSSERVLLVTPPRVDAECWNASAPGRAGDRSRERTRRFAERVVSVAGKLGVPCLDLHAAMGEFRPKEEGGCEDPRPEGEGGCEDPRPEGEGGGDPWRCLLEEDGLHLSAAGNAFLFGKISRCIEENWPELGILPDDGKGEGLPFVYPHHSQVDNSDPASSFAYLEQRG